MEKLIQSLNKIDMFYMGTVNSNGVPKMRFAKMIKEKDGILYFSASGGNELHKDLKKCPYVEISGASSGNRPINIFSKVKLQNVRNFAEASSSPVLTLSEYIITM